MRGRAAVLASVPGDTHTLGVTMASDLLRNKGWDIDLKVGRSHEQLVEEIEASDYTVIGLSGASRRSLLPLMRLIVALRICKPTAKIMVSGQIASGVDLVRTAGADEVASDFAEALAAMERLAGFA
jgi:MerR family transcriptional regulator, light-induced transcriptional regulator